MKHCCFKADGARLCVLTLCLKRIHKTSVRHAHKLKVRLILTSLTAEVTQVLSHSLDECRASLAPTLMSSPAAVIYIVTVVCDCCTHFAFASRGISCCLQLSIDCLNLVPLIVHVLTQHSTSHALLRHMSSCGACHSTAIFCCCGWLC